MVFGLFRQSPAVSSAPRRPAWLEAAYADRTPDDETLSRAQSRVQSQSDLQASLGIRGSPEGEPPEGVLSRALDILDRPKSAIVGALTSTADDSPIDRLVRGATGQEQFSFSDIDALDVEEDAGAFDPGNLLRRGVGFAGDVVADPLTYVTFGGSVLGKRLASEVVDNTLRQQAVGRLGADGLRRWADEATGIAAARTAVKEAPDATAREVAEAHLRRATDLPESELAELGARQFSGRAAEEYVRGGSTGLRRFLKGELGDEAGEEAFSALPRDVQGGLRIRAPFWRDPITRGPASVGVGGGGRILEHLGLDDAAVSLHGWRNRRRAQGLGRQIADKMSGRDGAAYGEMVEALIAGNADSPLRASYAGYAATREVRREAQQLGMAMHRATQDAVGPAELLLQTAPDEASARQAYQRWFEDPDAVGTLLRGARRVDGGAEWDSPGVSAIADQNERVGAMAAMYAHDFIRQQPEKLRRLGVSIEDINEYVPRILSDSERELRATARPVNASRGQRGGALAYNPTRQRDRYMTARFVEGADGTPQVEFGWQATSDINEQAGRMVFTEDPTTVTAAYGDAVRQLATRARFAQLLQRGRVVAQGGSEYQRILGGRAVRSIGEALNLEGVDTGAYLRQAAQRAQTELEAARTSAGQVDTPGAGLAVQVVEDHATATRARLDTAAAAPVEQVRRQVLAEQKLAELNAALDRFAADHAALSEKVVDVVNADDVNVQFEQLDTLMDGLTDFYARNAAVRTDALEGMTREDAQALKEGVRRVRERLAESRRAAGQAKSGKGTLDPATRLYRQAGLEPLGGVREEMPLLALPAELDQTYAAPMVRRMAEAYYKAQGPDSSELKGIVESYYRPYFAWFKATATIGRGPGYHARNTIGGMWNNYLYGVSGADHGLSAKLGMARHKAWRDAVAEAAGQVASAQEVSEAWARKNLPRDVVARRADDLVREATSTVEVGDGLTLYDVHLMGLAEEIGWGGDSSRLGEALGGSIRRQKDPQRAVFWQADPLTFDQTREHVNVFRGRAEADLNWTQRATNRSLDWWWINRSKQWAAMSEDYVRYAAFIRGIRQYGADDQGRAAGLLSRALHFDYGDLSPFEEKRMRGTLVPFYVWSRQNVPLQFRALLKDPGKMHKVGMTRDALDDLWGDDEKDVVPEWMQERFGFVSRFSTSQGDNLLIGLETPASDLNAWLKVGRPGEAGRSMLRNLGSNISPVFKLPAEVLFGVDAFTGARLDEGGAQAPQWARVIPGLTWEDSQGDQRMPHVVDKVLNDTLPWAGQAQRLLPQVLGSEDQERRLGTSWASTLFAAPAATQTPRQEAGETMARAFRLQRRIGRTDQPLVDQARALLEQGYPPERVRAILSGEDPLGR